MAFAMQGLLSALHVPLGKCHRIKVSAQNVVLAAVLHEAVSDRFAYFSRFGLYDSEI